MPDRGIKVSVIVLTYNQKQYIRQAIESILMQDAGFAFEILAGDDASSDGTSDILREYASKRPDLIQVFIRPQNAGATANLCDLFSRARGQYIIGCEGDDYWTDAHKLRKQAAYMDAHHDCAGCTHPVTIVDEYGSRLNNQKLPWICDTPVYTLKDFKGLFLPGHPVSLLHKNIFNEKLLAFIERAHKYIADRTIAMLLAASGDIHRLDDNMACYRKIRKYDGNNVTSMLYAGKDNAKLEDYLMTNILEDYARNELKVDADFSWFRRNLLIRALGKAVLKPSKAANHCLGSILKEWGKNFERYSFGWR